MLDSPPRAKELLGDTGYDADWFRHALTERGITAWIFQNHRKQRLDMTGLYRKRHGIENMLDRLKD